MRVFESQMKSATLRFAMALTPDQIQEWIAANGPYLYHGAHPRAGGDPEAVAQSILREGIQPNRNPWENEYPGHPFQEPCPGCGTVGSAGDDDKCNVCGKDYIMNSELDGSLEEWWHHPRPGHVFMVTDPEMAYGQPRFRIDLRKIDPTKIKADDDYLRDHHPELLKFHKWTEPTPENPPKTLGEQAQELNWGTDPNHTYDSLAGHGVVAYEGHIPPGAIERI